MTLGMIWTIILRFAIQDINVEGRQPFDHSVALYFIISAVLNVCDSFSAFHCCFFMIFSTSLQIMIIY